MLKQGIKQRAMMLLAWLWRFYSRRFNQVGLRRFLLHERFGYPLDFTFEVDQSALKQRLRETALHRHDEYLYDYQQACYIEPSYGFIITKHLFLIKRSFAYDHMVQSVPIRALLQIIRLMIKRNYPIHQFDQAISLRDMNEGNYWHFHDDILSKLLLINALNLGHDVPILVGERLWRTAFFQYAIQCEQLRDYNWHLHTKLVYCRRLIFCRKMSLQRENFDFDLAVLQAEKYRAPGERRIFLNRNQNRKRHITNIDVILDIMREWDFEIVDADALHFTDQMALFSQARYVIGLHGAGLTNLVYRQYQPLNVLELFSPDHVNPHYVWLCHTFGYGYDALVGTASDGVAWTIDPAALRTKIARMMQNSHVS